jgi:hypothetical protein
MAGTITGTIDRIPVQQGRPQLVELILLCTADAVDHSFPSTIINHISGISDFDLRGLKLNLVKAIPDPVTPITAASELTVLDKYGVDLLGGKGLDFLSNTEKTWTFFGPLDYYLPVNITGDITLNISGNLVDSAKCTLIIELIGT